MCYHQCGNEAASREARKQCFPTNRFERSQWVAVMLQRFDDAQQESDV